MLTFILQQFGFNEDDHTLIRHGKGLINDTWLIETKISGEKFILQRINHAIFRSPEDIAFNIWLVDGHLKQYHPGYLFVAPLKTNEGKELVKIDGQYFRLFPFVKGSHTIDVVEMPEQAYEAAKQFGKLTKLLAGLDSSQLKITLPDFHNLSLRYQQFENALINGDKEKIKRSIELIRFIQQHRTIATEFEAVKINFKTRCTHHDTKISNILFDENDKGLCVIDLDTLMPGHFISDVGDMMRTYLSPVSEEESNFSVIEIRPAFYHAIIEGYGSEMNDELNNVEKGYFLFAGKYMIYMQAIRFLTDFINNDIYYGSKYGGQNFVRAGNQVTLLQRLLEFELAGKAGRR